MARSRFVCSQCGRISSLPDFCCGQAMLPQGSFYCKTCGSSASSAAECCGQPMKQL